MVEPTDFNDFLLNEYDAVFDDVEDQQNEGITAEVKGSDFTVLKKLGEGGWKIVYEVTEASTGRAMAMAVFKGGSEQEKDRFIREACLTAKLDHPAIVPVYSWSLGGDETPYFTMRLIDGPELGIFRQEVSAIDGWLPTFKRIAQAVSYAHSRGVIHLDLKPENCCLDSYGDVVVLDWGLAGIMDAGLLADVEKEHCLFRDDVAGSRRGTPLYMSPEQINEPGLISSGSDIYSLGAILHFLLLGKHPDSPLTKEQPKALRAIAGKAMAENPGQRYRDVNELLADVERYQHGFPVEAENPGVLQKVFSAFVRHRQPILILSSFFLVIVALQNHSLNQLRIEKDNTETARREIQKVADELILEKEAREKAAKQASKVLYQIAYDHYYITYNLNDAYEAINNSVAANPRNRQALRLKALLEFSQLHMHRAKKIIDEYNLKVPVLVDALNIALPEAYSAEDILTLIKVFDDGSSEANVLIRHLVFQLNTKHWSLTEKIDFAKGELQQQAADNYNFQQALKRGVKPVFSVEEKDDGLDLFLEGYFYLNHLAALRHLPVKGLSVKNVRLHKLDALKANRLTRLSVPYSHISSLSFTAGMPLEYVDIAECKIKDLSVLKSAPLKHLTVDASMLPYLYKLYDFKDLKSIAISGFRKEHESSQILKALKGKFKVTCTE